MKADRSQATTYTVGLEDAPEDCELDTPSSLSHTLSVSPTRSGPRDSSLSVSPTRSGPRDFLFKRNSQSKSQSLAKD